MKLLFERVYPYILGLLAGIIWYQLEISFPSKESILSSTLTVSGIFVGFLATSKAILMSMSSPILDDLKESGYITDLVSYVGQAIWINLFFCSLNVTGYFVAAADWFAVIWVATAVASLASFIRVTNIMLKIFKFG